MRLTLRALLAWMDDNLPAEDAEIISQKVAESELATNLKNQIRHVVQIPNLPASIILDSTPMGDPNAAAEYLDNYMSPEETVEYEKHCIYSDVVLAEVASCHQILTMVLGEPAEVSPEVRHKVYELHARYFSEEVLESSVAEVMQELSQEIISSPSEEPEIKSSSWKKVLSRAIILAIIFLLAFWCMGRLMPNSTLGHLASKLLPFSASGITPTDAESSGNEEEPKVPSASATEDISVEKSKNVGDSSVYDKDTKNAVSEDLEGSLSKDKPKSGDLDESDSDVLDEGEDFSEEDGDFPGRDVLNITKPGEPGSEGPRRIPPPRRVGRVESGRNQIIGVCHAGEKTWGRLGAQAGINLDSTLISFPTYRPIVSFVNRFEVSMIDASQLQVLPGQEGAVSTLSLDYGQFIIKTYSSAQDTMGSGKVSVTFPSFSGWVTFPEANSRVAINVFREEETGQDPAEDKIPVHVYVYVMEGTIVIEHSSAGEPVAIPEGSFIDLSQLEVGPVKRVAPDWVRPRQLSIAEAAASRILAETLESGQLLEHPLDELTQNQNSELAWLSMQCLGQIGDFLPLITNLNGNEEEHFFQESSIEELQHAIFRSVTQAAQVKRDFLRFTRQGEVCYRMLWAYPMKEKAQMSINEGRALLEALKSEEMQVRVLGHWNLMRFCGKEAPDFYRPDMPADQRAEGIQKWSDFIDKSTDIFIKN
ncbi:MAG: hypothetical protein Q4C96_05155 [Planctomycetia bacterium]|nr:hypothetical protein [Planctomycetia bacterium]